MAWSFRLVTAPVEDFDASTPGLVNFRTVEPGYNGVYAVYEEGDLEQFVPRITTRARSDIQDLLYGGGKLIAQDRESVDLTVDVDAIDPDGWEALQRIIASGRPVMFTPWYDKTTWWMSHFGGKDDGGGLACVGDSDSAQYTGRKANNYYPSWLSEGSGLNYNGQAGDPKITRGMIGKAILLERSSENKQTGGGWTTENGAVQESTATGHTSTFIPLDTSGGTSIPALRITTPATLTNGVRYVASVWICGEGPGSGFKLRATHNSGATNVDATVVLDGKWQRVSVSWTQVGTSYALRLINTSVAGGVMARVGFVQVEAGYGPTSYIGSGATTIADKLYIGDTLSPTDGVTLVFWFRFTNNSDAKYFATWRQDATDCYVHLTAGAYYARIVGAADVSATAAGVEGAWTQLAVVMATSAGGQIVNIYENGVLIGNNVYSSSYRVPVTDSGMYIGSDEGLATPGHKGLDMPLDAVRIDARAWTAGEVLDDYNMRSGQSPDQGIPALLARTQGRLFRIVGEPGEFRVPITEQIIGELRLEQCGYILPGLA